MDTGVHVYSNVWAQECTTVWRQECMYGITQYSNAVSPSFPSRGDALLAVHTAWGRWRRLEMAPDVCLNIATHVQLGWGVLADSSLGVGLFPCEPGLPSAFAQAWALPHTILVCWGKCSSRQGLCSMDFGLLWVCHSELEHFPATKVQHRTTGLQDYRTVWYMHTGLAAP